ncbi:MAG: D-glycerate dehydrogenase [Phycisphaerales bacterium]|nr:D-glycerate dehydrogenase [Phycisphaerales bacterium]MCI0630306.1 D-glycerate dehydrogenase [Phycisphaerales bacterium]MCI0677299.1 D-glycerate dehydrogenase [Phycisphaerales bacterium]
MADPRIVITRPLPGEPVKLLAQAGFRDVWINPHDERLSRPALLEAVRGAVAVLATPADTLINAEFFDAAGPQLKIVSNYAVGVDNTDLKEAKRRGIVVGHTPHAVTEPTADIAWLLLLGAAKRASEGEQLVRSGRWTGVAPLQLLGRRVIGKTLLIVGAGRIGLAMARRSIGWEMNVLYHARSRHPEFEKSPINARRVSLEDGLREADFVSVHTPMNESTRHLIDATRLAMMKPTAILINTSRGGVIDEAALVEALRSQKIAAAGLDVYEKEPQLAPGLAELENTFLLPHLGSATVEDRTWMMEIAVANIIAALKSEPIPHAYPI